MLQHVNGCAFLRIMRRNIGINLEGFARDKASPANYMVVFRSVIISESLPTDVTSSCLQGTSFQQDEQVSSRSKLCIWVFLKKIFVPLFLLYLQESNQSHIMTVNMYSIKLSPTVQ